VLGIGGKFAGAKGMVAVPNLSGLSRSSAQAAITNAGLVFFENTTPVDTTNSLLDNKVSGQSLTAGTLVDYETVVSYSYNRYVAPPPSGPTLVSTDRLTPVVAGIVYECSGTTRIGTPTEQVQVSYKYTYSDGSVITTRSPGEDGQVIYITNDKVYEYNSTDCGYVPPALCNSVYQDQPTSWGECVNGVQNGTIVSLDTTCDGAPIIRSTSRSCCVSEQIFVSYWSGSCINCYKLTATRYRDSCTGQETVYNGTQYCCSGGGGGAQVAL
jgi:hypothetical protein